MVFLREDISWPLRSSDLNPCDFLWGYLKAKVFKHSLLTLDQLKEAIQKEIGGISLDMLVRVMENFQEWFQICIARQGYHSI